MKKITAMIIGISILLFTGCENTQDKVTSSETSVEQILLALIDGDESLSLDGFADDDAIEGEYEEGLEFDDLGKVLTDTLTPSDSIRIKLGRRILNVDREVIFTDLDNDTAYGEIIKTITGSLHIKIKNRVTGDTTSWVKPFTTDFIRKVRFVQGDSAATDSTDGWVVDAISLGVGITGNKVNILKLEIFALDGADPVFTFEGDVANQFISRHDIPTFAARTFLRTEVTVSNSGPEFPFNSGEMVSLHYGINRRYKARRILNDVGYGLDETVSDNIFTGKWRINGPGRRPDNDQPYQRRKFRSFFDVVDYGTIFAQDEAVHSVFWTLPYRSVRSN